MYHISIYFAQGYNDIAGENALDTMTVQLSSRDRHHRGQPVRQAASHPLGLLPTFASADSDHFRDRDHWRRKPPCQKIVVGQNAAGA